MSPFALTLYFFPRSELFTFLFLAVVCQFIRADGKSRDSGIWFSREPEDVIVVAGSSAILHCVAATSDPNATPVILWRDRDNQIIDFRSETHMSQLSNGSLYISSVLGRAPETLEKGSGLEERFSCMASVESIGRIVSRWASVNIARLPPLTHEPQSLHVYPGQTAHFSCRSEDAVPQPTTLWLKDQRPITHDETRMVLLPTGSLEIDDVQHSDTGVYQCNLTSLDGFRLSNLAYLTVSQDIEGAAREMPPEFIATPKNTIALEGSTVTLDCAANGNPPPWIHWLKDGRTLDMALLDSRYSKIGTGSLQIANIVEADNGDYQCRAENREDSVDTQASLFVQVAPRFIKKPVSKSVAIKHDEELVCEVFASPEPKVYWLKNGDPISSNNEYLTKVNGNNLRILGVMELDYGIFQCVASNPAGNIQSAALLTVTKEDVESKNESMPTEKRPTLESSPIPEVGRSSTGAPRDLEASVVKPQFVTLKWKPPALSHGEILRYSVFYKERDSERERVVDTSRSRLEEANVSNLRPNTTYSFRVAAITVAGIGFPSDPLVVTTRSELRVPGSPLNVKAEPFTNQIIVSWSPPLVTNGKIQLYKLYYYEYEVSEEHHIETEATSYTLIGLKSYTEYFIWVTAYNHNGAGSNSEQITVRTLSDVPSEPPTNVTVDAVSSTSVIVKWEPPPPEGCNGAITGYKLRYRMRDKKGRSTTVTTAGNKRSHEISNLEKGSVYIVRIWAMTINGTGPPTDWFTIETYEKDLDETTVPDEPSDMKAKANSDSITVQWSPPKNTNTIVRDYVITWGKGFPDEYMEHLDGKAKYHVIKNLEPNSEYVISLRAHNNRGDGPPVYENVRTRAPSHEDLGDAPLLPPVGLKANVVSPTSIVLFWSDASFSPDQRATDGRYYVVRYNQFHHAAANTHYRFHNSTVLSYMIDDLKPFTQYEFVVRVVKGNRESPWSMMAANTTWEALPSSPPSDVTVMNMENNPGTVLLSWQRPKNPNGLITGYIVSFTTDLQSRDSDWATESVTGDKMVLTIKALSLSTTYYFHVKAKNRKGYSMSSPVVSVTTPSAGFGGIAELGNPKVKGAISPTTLMYIVIVASSVLVTGVAIGLVLLCCRKTPEASPERSKVGYTKANKPGISSLKPPDLWIHHDQMELKNLEKNQEHRTSTGTIPRSTLGGGDTPPPDGTGTLEKTRHIGPDHHHRDYATSYVGSQCQPLLMPQERTSTLRRGSKQKPITLPIDNTHFREPVATATPVGGNIGTTQVNVSAGPPNIVPNSGTIITPTIGIVEPRPIYPHPRPPQYNLSRVHVTVDASGAEDPYGMQSAASTGYECVQPPASQSNYGSSEGAKRLQGHPLKSFSVPAPPPQSAPTTPQQKHIVAVRAQASSPYKKAGSTSYAGGSSTSPLPAKAKVGAPIDDLPRIQASYSTEELNQEMANLEGLMKDLNAITASEFQC
ncbi:Neogenin C-terminus [Nesidiocoris tenuis]|uniref:Neogenin C-terminus n=1 Tax=Nesidiocoris tenuis TaxID=355587 RepID=A0ABN7AWE3_9HEMI|nr:Neogenin C-terminus [Nesidiocoris tenuis]